MDDEVSRISRLISFKSEKENQVMKKIITNTFAAIALATVSMTGYAADQADKSPMLLDAAQLDAVEAGGRRYYGGSSFSFAGGEAYARGRHTFTEVVVVTHVGRGYSFAGGHSISSASR
jgi:hypothetical protein